MIMSQNVAIWVLIILVLILATLPFYLQTPLLFLPWAPRAEQSRPAGPRWLFFIAFSFIFGGLAWGAYQWLSQQLFFSTVTLMLTTGSLLLIGAVLFYIPGWVNAGRGIEKSLFDRFIELTVLYVLVGLLGVAFEAGLGNVYPQQWEFYVITYSLFLVLGYPGFVIRYLLKRRRVLVSSS